MHPNVKSLIPATIISVIVTLILASIVVFVFYYKVDLNPQVADFAKVLSGAIVTKFGTVVDYWLGSSIGSKQKDDILINNSNSNLTQ